MLHKVGEMSFAVLVQKDEIKAREEEKVRAGDAASQDTAGQIAPTQGLEMEAKAGHLVGGPVAVRMEAKAGSKVGGSVVVRRKVERVGQSRAEAKARCTKVANQEATRIGR